MIMPKVVSRKSQDCNDCRKAGSSLFGMCRNDAAWSSYLQTRTLHRFRSRQTIFHEGTPSPLVYILCKGQVKLSIAGRFGISRIVRLVSADRTPCEILDKAGLGAPAHSVTCETLTDCQMCCLRKADFVRLMDEAPEFAGRVMTEMSAEAGLLLENLRAATAGQLRARLAKTLVRLAEQHGIPTADGTDLDLSLSRREWAEILGTSRETVARQLHALQREGLLALNGRRITILACERLQRLGV